MTHVFLRGTSFTEWSKNQTPNFASMKTVEENWSKFSFNACRELFVFDNQRGKHRDLACCCSKRPVKMWSNVAYPVAVNSLTGMQLSSKNPTNWKQKLISLRDKMKPSY